MYEGREAPLTILDRDRKILMSADALWLTKVLNHALRFLNLNSIDVTIVDFPLSLCMKGERHH